DRRPVQLPRDRAKVPPGADQYRGADLFVDDPSPSRIPYRVDRGRQPQARARSLQQIVIELAAPDSEAHGPSVPRLDVARAADDAGAKAGNGLERPARAIVVDVQSELGDHLRRDPAG